MVEHPTGVLSDSEIVKMRLEDLTAVMDRHGFSETLRETTRDRRRKLQNRGSAKSSSARKRMNYKHMVTAFAGLEDELSVLRGQNNELIAANLQMYNAMKLASDRAIVSETLLALHAAPI
jgi:hypothetical protein